MTSEPLMAVDDEGPFALSLLLNEGAPEEEQPTPEDAARLRALNVGETCQIGGGAAATFTVRRVS